MTSPGTTLKDGIIPPVLTPLTTDHTVDEPALRQLLRHMIDGGVHGLFVAGTAGLGSILTQTEYEKLITTALDEVGDRLPVLMGVLESSTARALERVKLLETLGAKAFVTVTPYYCRATKHDDLLRHFGALRDSTHMEMVVYNIPICTNVEIPIETMVEMAKRGWMHACKDSSGDDAYFTTLCRDSAAFGLRVYQGMHPDFAQLHRLNAAGCVPVPGNVCPETFVAAWENRANPDMLPELQETCDTVWNDLVQGMDFTSAAIRKLATMGIGTGTKARPWQA